MLTIAIPIYNGRSHIINLLTDIKSIYSEDLKIIIHENNSNNTIEDLIESCSFPIKYIKHSTNIGFDANVASLVNECDTEYIWFFGCDDRIETSYFNHFYNDLKNLKPSTCILNWSSFRNDGKLLHKFGIKYNSSFFAKTFEDFSNIFGAQFFLSSMIIKKELLNNIHYKDYTKCPGFFHWYLFMRASENEGIYFYNNTIVKHITGNEVYSDKWIDVFFINYPEFIYTYVKSKIIRNIFLKQNLNLSMTVNIIDKKAKYGNLGIKKVKKIISYFKKYPKFYFFIFLPLLLNNRLCKVLINIKNKFQNIYVNSPI